MNGVHQTLSRPKRHTDNAQGSASWSARGIEPIARRTLSLKWKALIVTGIVLLVITSLYTALSYVNLIRQFGQQREVLYERHARQVHGLIAQSLARMGHFAGLTPSLSGIGIALAARDAEQLQRAFEEHWVGLQLHMGLDIARFYDAEGRLLGMWRSSGFVSAGQAQTPPWVQEALEMERSRSVLDCVGHCIQFAAAPLLVRGQIVGVMEYGIPLTDIVLEFRQNSGYDVALLVDAHDSGVGAPATRALDNWRVAVLALTNASQNLQLLQQAAQEHPRMDEVRVGTTTTYGARNYEITVIPLVQFARTGKGYFAVIADITDPLARIQKATRKNLLVGMFGLMLALLMVLALLWKPMTRLRHTADTLPLLGQGAFERVRQAIRAQAKPHWARDEVDVLDDTAIALAGRLDFLEDQVQEHTRALGQRMDELEDERDFVRNLLDTAQVIILTQNDTGDIKMINQFGVQLSGYGCQEIVGRRFDTLFARERFDIETTTTQAGIPQQRHRSKLHGKDGSTCEIDWLHTPLSRRGDQEPLTLSLGLDVTEQRQAERRLLWLADHDALSGLFNRRRFQEELRRTLAEAQRFGHSGALLFFDLDQFKYINDTSGHQAGDTLLRIVAHTLKHTVRETDITARLGGDEFAVLISNTDQRGAIKTARKISQELTGLELPLGERSYRVSASIGIALFPEHATDVPGLLAAADLAMYKVKDAGRGGWHVFSLEDPSRERMRAQVMWKERVEQALAEDRFVLHYQPIIELQSRSMTHCEALIRMLDDDGTLIMPGSFIEASERTGLIHAIDKCVLGLGIAQLVEFTAAGLDVRLSLNLSGHAFENQELPSTLEALLAKHHVKPGDLIFEITETAAVVDLVAARGLMESIREMGCHFALDDFGAGFSSLRYLKHLPVDYVKIDGAFVRNLGEDRDNRVMVKAITDVAQGFGKKTVAEFVESAEVLTLLEAFGVDYAQGYYVGPPVSAEALMASRLPRTVTHVRAE